MNDAIMISTLHASMLHLMPIVITFVSANAHGESQAFIKNWCRTQNSIRRNARYRWLFEAQRESDMLEKQKRQKKERETREEKKEEKQKIENKIKKWK